MPEGNGPSLHKFTFLAILVAIALSSSLLQVSLDRPDDLRRKALDSLAQRQEEWRRHSEEWKRANPFPAEEPPPAPGPSAHGAGDASLDAPLPAETSTKLLIASLAANWLLGITALALVLLARQPGEAAWRLKGMAAGAAACAGCTVVAFVLCHAMENPFGSRAFQVFVLAPPLLLLGIVITGFSLRRFPPTGGTEPTA